MYCFHTRTVQEGVYLTQPFSELGSQTKKTTDSFPLKLIFLVKFTLNNQLKGTSLQPPYG